MKKNRLFAIVLSGLLLTGNMLPVGATYQSSEEIAFAVRPVDVADEYIYDEVEGEKTIYLYQDDLKEGKKLHLSVFVEAETQQIDVIDLVLQTNTPKITFDSESFVPPNRAYYETEQIFTLPDGTEFSTDFKPYCFGSVGLSKVYNINCMFFSGFDETQAAFSSQFLLMPGAKHEFLGGQSDLFSFVDLHVDVAPGIESGIYRVGFAEPTEEKKKPNCTTYIVDSQYIDTIPTLKGCNICVGKRGDIDGNGVISADDASKILIYAAESGSGAIAKLTEDGTGAGENLACFVADVTGDKRLDATDAANILTYAAIAGSGKVPDWNEIISQND